MKAEPFNISARINGYLIELSGDYDCGDFVTQCHVSYTRHSDDGREYSSSLACLADTGFLDGITGGWKVAPAIIAKMEDWAADNGY